MTAVGSASTTGETGWCGWCLRTRKPERAAVFRWLLPARIGGDKDGPGGALTPLIRGLTTAKEWL